MKIDCSTIAINLAQMPGAYNFLEHHDLTQKKNIQIF